MAKSRGSLTDENVKKLIGEWDKHNIKDFAEEFDVSTNTIMMMVKQLRNLNPDVCPPKPRGGNTRKQLAENALKELGLLKKEK